MGRGLLLVLAVVAASLTAAGCAKNETRVDVTYGDFVRDIDVTRTIDVAPGTVFEVSLFSNPQSGFKWSEAEVSEAIVLSERNREFVPLYGEQPHEKEPSGLDVFTFEALCKGQTRVGFLYSRPWDGGQQTVWTFTLVVRVS